MESSGYADPRKLAAGPTLHPAFTSLFQQFQDADPSPHPQLALPVATVQWIQVQSEAHPADTWIAAVADLITLAFFFLLRVGEYTVSTSARRTVPLRLLDIQLWQGDTHIPTTATPAERLSATAVTICLENQKNGSRDATIHHTAVPGSPFCPVKAAARRLNHLQGLHQTTPICTFRASTGALAQVKSAHIVTVIRLAVQGTGLQGYASERVGSHSLRASGAMALKLNGFDEVTIQKLGRWSSNTYLRYIHSQIGALTTGTAASMARDLHFVNVATSSQHR